MSKVKVFRRSVASFFNSHRTIFSISNSTHTHRHYHSHLLRFPLVLTASFPCFLSRVNKVLRNMSPDKLFLPQLVFVRSQLHKRSTTPAQASRASAWMHRAPAPSDPSLPHPFPVLRLSLSCPSLERLSLSRGERLRSKS